VGERECVLKYALERQCSGSRRENHELTKSREAQPRGKAQIIYPGYHNQQRATTSGQRESNQRQRQRAKVYITLSGRAKHSNTAISGKASSRVTSRGRPITRTHYASSPRPKHEARAHTHTHIHTHTHTYRCTRVCVSDALLVQYMGLTLHSYHRPVRVKRWMRGWAVEGSAVLQVCPLHVRALLAANSRLTVHYLFLFASPSEQQPCVQ
jgi:hypothetical protein